MNNIKVFLKEGLEFLVDIPDNSIDLILTDPPYITSRDTGMDKWAKHVEQQDKLSNNVKTEEDWDKYKSADYWEQ